MNKILRIGFVLIAVVALSSIAVFSQTSTTGFTYAFPDVTAPGLQLVISNVNSAAASVQVTFYNEAGAAVQNLQLSMGPGTQTIVDDSSVSLGSFVGAAIVQSATPLAVNVTTNTGTSLDSAAPAVLSSSDLVIPFARAGANGNSTISIFNPTAQNSSVVLALGEANGTLLNGTQFNLAAKQSVHVSLNSLPIAFSDLTNVTYAVVKSLGGVLTNGRPVTAEGEVTQFNTPYGNVTQDEAVVQAVPLDSMTPTVVLPLFVQGFGYFTDLSIVNDSDNAQSVNLVARDMTGATIPTGHNPVTISIPPHGSYSVPVDSTFNLFTDTMGSISVTGIAPITAVGTLGSTQSTGLSVVAPAGAPVSSAALQFRSISNETEFVGLSLLNPNPSDATVSMTFITSDGFTISATQATVHGGTQLVDTLGDLMPEATGEGFLFLSNSQPIQVAAIEGSNSVSVLAPVQVSPVTTGFIPQSQNRFLAVGTATVSGAPIPGATVILTGTISSSQTTDSVGSFVFRDIPPGNYTVSIQLAGITFTPSSIPFTITNQNVRNLNFTGAIVGSTLTSITPNSALAGSGDLQITEKGGPFIPTSQLVFDGTAIPTAFVDQNTLTGTIPAAALRLTRVATVQVQNKVGSNVAPSQPLPFTVGNVAPVITSVAGIPAQIIAGYPGFNVTITGSGFNAGGTVEFAGVPRPFTFVSSTQVQAFIGPGDLAVGQIANLTVTNPQPTVGPSNAVQVTVYNPVAGLLSISPSITTIKIEVNSTGLQLVVNGFQFKPGATVQVAGFPALTSTYISSTQLTASIPPEALQVGGSFPVTVTNPAPNLGSSEVQPLIVQNLVPQLAGIDAGPLTFSPGVTEDKTVPVNFVGVLHGANFGKEYTAVLIPPSDPFPSCDEKDPIVLAPQVIESTEMVVILPIKCTGNFSVYASSPQQEPGGGTSGLISFTVSPPAAGPIPSLSSLAPFSISAGTNFELTINGTNFQAGALVNFGTAILTPDSISGSVITVSVPSYYVQSTGIVPVTVTNPGTGGTSTRLLFIVN